MVTTTKKVQALTDYRSGMRLREIAARHGVHTSTISVWAKEAGLARRSQGCREKMAPSVRDAQIVADLRNDANLPMEAVGDRYGISRARVHRIYHKWKDWKPAPPYKVGDKVRFMGQDYLIISAGVHEGKVRHLRTNKVTTISWHVGEERAVKI